ncbi:MAG: alpha/beta fold hydrolase [Streptosporangiaceae bacterium]
MDLLRQAVGDPVLNYLGQSCGTGLGAVYANLFPARVGYIVFDGNLDPIAWTHGGPSPDASAGGRRRRGRADHAGLPGAVRPGHVSACAPQAYEAAAQLAFARDRRARPGRGAADGPRRMDQAPVGPVHGPGPGRLGRHHRRHRPAADHDHAGAPGRRRPPADAHRPGPDQPVRHVPRATHRRPARCPARHRRVRHRPVPDAGRPARHRAGLHDPPRQHCQVTHSIGALSPRRHVFAPSLLPPSVLPPTTRHRLSMPPAASCLHRLVVSPRTGRRPLAG